MSSVLGLDSTALNELKSEIDWNIRNALNPTAPAQKSTGDKLDRVIVLLERLDAKFDAFSTVSPPIPTFAPAPSLPFAPTQPISEPTGTIPSAPSLAFAPAPVINPPIESPFPPNPSPHAEPSFDQLLANRNYKTRSEAQAHRHLRESSQPRERVVVEDLPNGSTGLLQSCVAAFPLEKLSLEEVRLQDYRYNLRYADEAHVAPPKQPFVCSPTTPVPAPQAPRYTPRSSPQSPVCSPKPPVISEESPAVCFPKSPFVSEDSAAKEPGNPHHIDTSHQSASPNPEVLFSFDPTLPPFASTSTKDVKPANSPRTTQPDFFTATSDSERYFFGLPHGKMRITKFSSTFGKVGAEGSLGGEDSRRAEKSRRVEKEDSPVESKEGTSTPDLLSRPPSSTVPSPPSELIPSSPPSFAFGRSTTSPAASFTFASPPPLARKNDPDSIATARTLFRRVGAEESTTSRTVPIDRAKSTTPTPEPTKPPGFVFSPVEPKLPVSPRPTPPSSPSVARSSTPVARSLTPVASTSSPHPPVVAPAPTPPVAAVSITPLYVPSLPPSGTRSFGGRSMKPPSVDTPSETSTTGPDRSKELSINGGSTGMYAGGWGGRAIKKPSSEVPNQASTSNHPSPTRVFVGKSSKGPSGKGGGIGNGIINNHPRTSKPRSKMRSSLSGTSSLGTGSMTPIQEWVQGADAGGEATWVEEEIVFVSREGRSPEI